MLISLEIQTSLTLLSRSEIPKTPFPISSLQKPNSDRSMWNNRRPPENDSGSGKDNSDQEKTIAKAAGFVVVSGIAMSILKALNPFNNQNLNSKISEVKATVVESASPQTQLQQCQPEPEPVVKVVYLLVVTLIHLQKKKKKRRSIILSFRVNVFVLWLSRNPIVGRRKKWRRKLHQMW